MSKVLYLADKVLFREQKRVLHLPKQVSCLKSLPPTFPVVLARILKNDITLVPTLISAR